jgi:hypothetical protein
MDYSKNNFIPQHIRNADAGGFYSNNRKNYCIDLDHESFQDL